MQHQDQKRPKPVVLIILDGWGVGPAGRGNAITVAKTPTFDRLTRRYLTTTIEAAGESVGLPWGEQGNSEVGHTHIGAGRIIYQDLMKINRTIADGTFFENTAFLHAITHVLTNHGTLHIMGILSDGGVHGSQTHVHALLELVKAKNVSSVCVHAFLDGRDVSYRSGLGMIAQLKEKVADTPGARIASVVGRFYAMDRDNHWDRTKVAFDGITSGIGEVFDDPEQAVAAKYEQGVFDERMDMLVVRGYLGVGPNDAIIFTNFRPDRARQLTRAFTQKDFSYFDRPKLDTLFFVGMKRYDASFGVESAFVTEVVDRSMCEVIADAGLSQLHIAETEKYAHVTYFLNGGREEPFEKQVNVLVPSLPVKSYDETPEMRAYDITKRMVAEIGKDSYDVYIANFANADMVGHTGNFPATVKAVEVIDQCLKKIADAVLARGGIVCITADHGNAEQKFDFDSGEILKGHSDSPVPFIVVGQEFEHPERDIDLSTLVPSGVLADVGPTILKILHLEKPSSMIGVSLV